MTRCDNPNCVAHTARFAHHECSPCKDDLLRKECFDADDVKVVLDALDNYFPE